MFTVFPSLVTLLLTSLCEAAPLNLMTYVTSSEGSLKTTLDIDEYFFEEESTGTKLWTRVYNRDSSSGNILNPGPILKFRYMHNIVVSLV